MNRSVFTGIAFLVGAVVIWIVIAGNHLPAELRARIESEAKITNDARAKIANQRSTVANEASSNADVFAVRGFNTEWPARFNEANTALDDSSHDAVLLARLLKHNNREDRAQIEQLLDQERSRRTAALDETSGVVAEAQKRVDLKRNFPSALAKIESSAKALETQDDASLKTRVAKAENDWPSHKEQLETKLDALLTPQHEAAQWVTSAHALEAKSTAELTPADYTEAVTLQDDVDHAPGPTQAAELSALSGQLYTTWDNVLIDLDKGHDEYREKLKHVVTIVPAPTAKGVTTSAELWQPVTPDQWRSVENDVGMSVAHKPLGEFDSEVSHTPEPAGFAYMASPAQGRNQYGYWDNSGGGSMWHWLPEYLILSSLLNNRSYVPVPVYEWSHYQQAQRYGQTYYGRDESGAPRYGSHGTFTLQHYGNSRYVQTGGFSGSKYASGGGFSGSRYGSGSSSASAGSSSANGQRFGSSSNSSSGHRFGSSSSGRSFGSSHSSGHSFGGHHR